MAESTTVTIPDIDLFKQKALLWANHFGVVCLLDSNNYAHDKYKHYSWMLAVDAIEQLSRGANAFEELKKFQQSANGSVFGFLTYDLKNQVEKLESSNADALQFPELYFFKPRYLFEVQGNKLRLNRNYPETFEIVELIEKMPVTGDNGPQIISEIKCSTAKDVYLQNVEQIKKQIEAGDFYELNYCLEFKAETAHINPVQVFNRLNQKAQAPFSCFFKLHDKYLLCASPERFLKKTGSKLISQPIKGTIKTGSTAEENEQLKQQLKNDIKERAENVMIVDLVRNDLARSAKPATVLVEELFGVYTFNTVNQMISTVSAEIRDDVHFIDAIKNAFPMGSMTGAPKIEVMKHIERYEDFKRGLYSGSVGYIAANGDFDFNVVIRSILYNQATHYLSLPAGGAITYDSNAEKEYEEILLKARNMREVLQENPS
jgi:para-aminobenzoate synthetase component 1